MAFGWGPEIVATRQGSTAPPRGSQPCTWIKLTTASSGSLQKTLLQRLAGNRCPAEPHVALGTKFNKCSIPLVRFLSQKKSSIQLPVSGMFSIFFSFSYALPWKSALKPKLCGHSQLKHLWPNRAKERARPPEEAWKAPDGRGLGAGWPQMHE